MSEAIARQGMTATVEITVKRADGTVETHEGEITHLDEEAIKQLISGHETTEPE